LRAERTRFFAVIGIGCSEEIHQTCPARDAYDGNLFTGFRAFSSQAGNLPQKEQQMSHDSSIHYFLNWAKGRIDEMDAAVASLEAKAGEVQADLRGKANEALTNLRKKSDDIKAVVKKQAEDNEVQWNSIKGQLEGEWTHFETEMRKYVETFGDKVKQQQSTFMLQSDAQLKAWRDAADKFHTAGTKFATDRRTEFDATVTRMKADAGAAEEKLDKLRGAETASWSALMAGLTETRASFDRANQSAREAFKKANAA
jgi:hypothetical protein